MQRQRIGIIFVHGIQGSPRQFHFLLQDLPDSVLCRNILLPGHGATTKEFKQADALQWLNAVKKESLRLREQCDQVIFVGHSMGCLLGLLTQQEYDLFSGTLLVCCPFFIRPTFRYFRNNMLASITKGKTNDPFIKATWEANSVSSKSVFSYLFCVRPYLELFKLIRYTKEHPVNFPPNTIFCFSELDEIVSRKSISYANDQLNAETEVLSQCGHNFFTESAQNRLLEIMRIFVNPHH